MSNIRICFRNVADIATVSASPALLTTLPETNLQRQERFRTGRSTSLASQDLKYSYLTAQRINFFHTRFHNFTAAAQQRVRTYTDSAWTSGVIDNAAANCFAYTGHARNDVLTEADFRLLKNSTRYVTLATNIQSVNITNTDAANPDGYFDISRIFMGEYYEFAYQMPYAGAALTFEDYSTQSMAHDGSLITDKGPKRRRIDLSSDWFRTADWAELLAGIRYAGKDKDIFVSLHPGDGTYLETYNQGLFKVQEPTAFDRHMYGVARQKLTLLET